MRSMEMYYFVCVCVCGGGVRWGGGGGGIDHLQVFFGTTFKADYYCGLSKYSVFYFLFIYFFIVRSKNRG